MTRTAPDDPTSAGGLTPSIQDAEAGLVAVPPGFDIRRYRTVVVERFPVEAAIARLGRGSGGGRHFLGLFGGGTTRAQVDTQLVDVASNRVVVVTADRRNNSTGGFAAGSDEDLLGESLNAIARDYTGFLVRLSRGEARGR